MSAFREKLYKAKNEKNGLQRWFARRYLFKLGERLGFHILGDHFYEPIPNLEDIRKNYEDAPREIPGHPLSIDTFEDAHSARLRKYGPEFLEAVKSTGFEPDNYYFRGADAISLYCLLRELKPNSVVEVGQGMSTRVALAALERNAQETGARPRFVSIDPYARLQGKDLKANLVEFEVIQRPLQQVSTTKILQSLEGKALLFVDSSHVYKYGSDVWHLTHKIYPFLPAGCLLHVHDIVLPFPWLKEFYLDQKWFWNEQEMLESFLTFNQEFEIVLPVHWLHQTSAKIQTTMAETFRDLAARDLGYSFYLRRKSA